MERIVGPENLTPEEVKPVAEQMIRWRKKGVEKIEGEFEKTAEELKAIDKINSFLAKESAEAGAEEKAEPILPEQIHYISTESYDKNFPEQAQEGADATYLEARKAVYINAEAFYRIEKYYATVHEMTHAASYHQTRIGKKEKFAAVKCGIGVVYSPGKKNFIKQFGGLNEAITEKITREIIVKHKEEIIKEFNLSEKETTFRPSGYGDFLKILDAAVKKTAEKNGEPEEETWKKIKKGYFEGEMMHLREIERACGAGALRMLAAIGVSPDFASRSETSEMILIYFQTDDEVKKEEIAKIILKKKEFKKYQKRQKILDIVGRAMSDNPQDEL